MVAPGEAEFAAGRRPAEIAARKTQESAVDRIETELAQKAQKSAVAGETMAKMRAAFHQRNMAGLQKVSLPAACSRNVYSRVPGAEFPCRNRDSA